MYQRILVPLDGSRVGEAALPHIEDLISKIKPEVKVEVTLLRVVSSLTHYVVAGEASVPVPYSDAEIAALKKMALNYLKEAGEVFKGGGAIIKTRVSTGRAADEIIKAAEEINADLIAMSTHGRSGISRWAFGSVTEKILQTGVVPILIVRAPKEIQNA